MQDLGKSDVMVLIILIHCTGVIWFLIITITKGNQGKNQYGSDPKEEIIF